MRAPSLRPGAPEESVVAIRIVRMCDWLTFRQLARHGLAKCFCQRSHEVPVKPTLVLANQAVPSGNVDDRDLEIPCLKLLKGIQILGTVRRPFHNNSLKCLCCQFGQCLGKSERRIDPVLVSFENSPPADCANRPGTPSFSSSACSFLLSVASWLSGMAQ